MPGPSQKVTVGIVGGSDLVKIREQLGDEADKEYDYLFSENGLMAFKKGELLKATSLKDHLGEDLVFRVAEPIVGGREIRDAKGRVERGAKEASVNNFQGRYVIRHPWKGPIACKNPIRGRWGGPPAGAQKKGPRAAQDLAFAPRGKVTLRTFVNANVTSPSQMHVSKGAPLGLLASIGEGQASQPATGSGIDEPTPPVSSATGGTPPPAMPAPLTTSDAPTTPPSSPP